MLKKSFLSKVFLPTILKLISAIFETAANLLYTEGLTRGYLSAWLCTYIHPMLMDCFSASKQARPNLLHSVRNSRAHMGNFCFLEATLLS